MTTLHFRVNDQQLSIKIEPDSDGYQLLIGEKRYHADIHNADENALSFTVDGHYQKVYLAPGEAADERRLWSNGEQWIVEKVDPRQRRQRGGTRTETGALKASMPGQVVQVLAAEGELISKGEPLVILEAMKMEIRISATKDGKVTALNCRVGDVVKRGQTLVTIGDTETNIG